MTTTHMEREAVLDGWDDPADRVRREPLKAAGLVFGMGALIGLGLGLGFASGLSRGSALGPVLNRDAKWAHQSAFFSSGPTSTTDQRRD